MIKHLLAFATAAVLCVDASAGYIQYNLTGQGLTTLDPSVLVIRDDDKSVAFFSISTQFGRFSPHDRGEYYHQNHLLQVTTGFRGQGPTNMYMVDTMQEEHTNFMWLTFNRGKGPKTFDYNMRIVTGPGPQSPYPDMIPKRDVNFIGTATEVAIDPDFAAMIDIAHETWLDLPRVVPTLVPNRVPEPASLALMLTGVFGAVAATRRRRAKT